MFIQTKAIIRLKILNHFMTSSYVFHNLTSSLHALEHQSHHEMFEASHRMHLCVVLYKEKTSMYLEFKFFRDGIMSLNVILDIDASFTFSTH